MTWRLCQVTRGSVGGQSSEPLEVEPDVEVLHRVGEPAQRDHVDAGFGDGAHALGGDAARGFGEHAAANHGHRLAQHRRRHVVEEDGVDLEGEQFFELGQGVDLDLDGLDS